MLLPKDTDPGAVAQADEAKNGEGKPAAPVKLPPVLQITQLTAEEADAIESVMNEPVKHKGKKVEADRVREFCQRHQITAELAACISLSRECFGTSQVELDLEQDAESDESWVLVDVEAPGPADAILGAYDRFVERWALMPNAAARQLIHLTFHMS